MALTPVLSKMAALVGMAAEGARKIKEVGDIIASKRLGLALVNVEARNELSQLTSGDQTKFFGFTAFEGLKKKQRIDELIKIINANAAEIGKLQQQEEAAAAAKEQSRFGRGTFWDAIQKRILIAREREQKRVKGYKPGTRLEGMGDWFGGSGDAGAWGGGPDWGAMWKRMSAGQQSPMRPTPFGAEFDAAPSRGGIIGQQTDWAKMREKYMPQMEEGAGMFAQSMQAAFSAVISGSGNAAQAFKQAMGQMLAAKATMLAGEAVYAGVMAIVNRDPSMGWAAAKAGAGAIALAAMARALGYGGNVPGVGAGAQSGGIKVGGTPGREGGTKVVILGDSFYGSGSQRQQAAQIRRVLADDSVIGS